MAVVIVAVDVQQRISGAWLRVPKLKHHDPALTVTAPRWCKGEIVYALRFDQVRTW